MNIKYYIYLHIKSKFKISIYMKLMLAQIIFTCIKKKHNIAVIYGFQWIYEILFQIKFIFYFSILCVMGLFYLLIREVMLKIQSSNNAYSNFNRRKNLIFRACFKVSSDPKREPRFLPLRKILSQQNQC